MAGPGVLLIAGLAVLVIGILVYYGLKDSKKEPGAGLFIVAVGILFLALGVIWYLVRREETKKPKEKVEIEAVEAK